MMGNEGVSIGWQVFTRERRMVRGWSANGARMVVEWRAEWWAKWWAKWCAEWCKRIVTHF